MAPLAASPEELLKSYAHRGLLDDAEALFRQMINEGDHITLVIYNSMIHSCTQVGDVTRAEHYLKMVEASGLKPNLTTYNMVINACAMAGESTRAEKWLLWILSLGMAPTEVTYGTICKAFARQGDVKAVERIMLACERSGSGLNEYFYASLIAACGASQPPDVLRAEQAFAELVRRNFRAHRVKRALSRVVGESRANYLMEMAVCNPANSMDRSPTGSNAEADSGCDNTCFEAHLSQHSHPAAALRKRRSNKPPSNCHIEISVNAHTSSHVVPFLNCDSNAVCSDSPTEHQSILALLTAGLIASPQLATKASSPGVIGHPLDNFGRQAKCRGSTELHHPLPTGELSAYPLSAAWAPGPLSSDPGVSQFSQPVSHHAFQAHSQPVRHHSYQGHSERQFEAYEPGRLLRSFAML